MRKPASLRDAIATLMVGLGQNPDKLAVAVVDGRIVATKANSASFEYRYLVDVLVQAFDGDVGLLEFLPQSDESEHRLTHASGEHLEGDQHADGEAIVLHH